MTAKGKSNFVFRKKNIGREGHWAYERQAESGLKRSRFPPLHLLCLPEKSHSMNQ